MDKINELSDELLIKILSFVPTKVAVSTSILSKRWEFLWMWVPNLDYNDRKDTIRSESSCLRYRDFINKNLPLHRAPIIESLCLRFWSASFQPKVGIAVSRCVRERNIDYIPYSDEPDLGLPSSLYTCKSLVTLKLEGLKVLVDIPRTVCLPSLKTLQLRSVTYLNKDSLRLLLSYCPVLEEDLEDLVTVPSLQRLSLWMDGDCSSHGYVIVTPSLKYFKVEDCRDSFHYLIEHMPKLEEADIDVEKDLDEFLESSHLSNVFH